MHASSYIRYLEMSKSCKIDTNSYSETGSLCSSDASEEFNLAPNVHRVLLIAFPFIKHIWCTETQDLKSSHRLRLQTVRHCGVLIPWQKWQAAFGRGRWRARRPALVQLEEMRLAGWQTGLHQDTTLDQVAPFSLRLRSKVRTQDTWLPFCFHHPTSSLPHHAFEEQQTVLI